MIATARIKYLRLQSNFTQSYIAHKLSVSQKTYSNMECGKSKITLVHLTKLAEVYKIYLVQLLEVVNQIDANSSNTIKIENRNINSSEFLDDIHLPLDYVEQLKGRIDDLKLLLESKNNNIQLLKVEIETLKKTS